jgi:hypothetical protein
MRGEAAVMAIPLAGAMVALSMFTVPNYLRARQWTQRADALRAGAVEVATRHEDYRRLQDEVDRLQRELKARNRELPLSIDRGRLLESLSASGSLKGIVTSESRTGAVNGVAVPGVPGGKAARRQVDAQLSGSFEALYAALATAERVETLVTARSVEFSRVANAGVEAPLEAHFQFDEYFDEGVSAEKPGKAGGP